MLGTIVKGISGFYYVYCEGVVYECKARGIFRKKGITPLAGDIVEIEVGSDNKGSIEKILDRKNYFDRPPVANVETFVLVAAAKNPDPSFFMLDRFTAAAEKAGASIIVCLNKIDLATQEMIDAFKHSYADIYPLFFISAKNGVGLGDLVDALKGKKFALVGPSGAGKSTLTNALLGQVKSEVGEISAKLERGKNTTRHTELFVGNEFFIFDTPGFNAFDLVEEDERNVAFYFPEFKTHLNKCKFNNCMHMDEPGCSVRDAVQSQNISKTRYDSYVSIVKTIKEEHRY